MNFVLNLIMCSAVSNSCLPPYRYPDLFKDGYSLNPYYLPFTKSLEFAKNSGDEPVKMKLCRCSKSRPECCCKKK